MYNQYLDYGVFYVASLIQVMHDHSPLKAERPSAGNIVMRLGVMAAFSSLKGKMVVVFDHLHNF